MKASEYFALPQEERDRIYSVTDEVKIDLNVHMDEFVRGRLDKIQAGTITVIESSVRIMTNDPDVEYVVLKLHNPVDRNK